MAAKKARPPTLSLQPVKRAPAATVIEFQTPIDFPDDDDAFPHSSPSSTSSSSPVPSDAEPDDLSKDLAVLERLRRSVQRNLRLRPIRSSGARTPQPSSSPSPPTSLSDLPDDVLSPQSAYYTPLSEFRPTPLSARFVGSFGHRSRQASLDFAARHSQPQSRPAAPLSPPHGTPGISPAMLLARLSAPAHPLLIDTRPVASFLSAHLQRSVNIAIPSLILKRSRKPSGAFQSLDALRQYLTTDDGKHFWDQLMSDHDWDGDVVIYDEAMDERDRQNPSATAWVLMDVIAPLLPHGGVDYLQGGLAAARRHPYLSQLLVSASDTLDHLELPHEQQQQQHAQPSAAFHSSKRTPGSGLFQLDIPDSSAARSKSLPEIERPIPSPPPPVPSGMASSTWNIVDDYSTPSPPPSSVVFTRPQPSRRPSIPALRKLDTKSAERLNAHLPKLQVRPVTAATLAAPAPSTSSLRSRSRSPSHLTLVHSNHSPPRSTLLLSPGGGTGTSAEFLPPPSPSYARPTTPRTPRTASSPIPPSPSTARPDTDAPPTTEEAFATFTVSTILPNFLYLGPEPTAEAHAEELGALGVKRILNIAIECDDDHGLRLRERFERYVRIPMRDTVEEDNITRGVREACAVLDDARLHSAPTYVHCKAGKSRSVTAVIAYLIHANHWTLSRAYAFVVERRRGVSPNIGFVSELMTFEEQELGGKSVGVVKMPTATSANASSSSSSGDHHQHHHHHSQQHHHHSASADHHAPDEGGGGGGMGGGGGGGGYQVQMGGRRAQHVRESLPPAFTREHSFNLASSSMSPSVVGDVATLGDSQQELEIKDAEGRYRHARRAPVDEATLQPMRRVSKAGLESSAYV